MSDIDKDNIALKEEIERLLYGTKYHTAKEWATLKRIERSHNKTVMEEYSLVKSGHKCNKDLGSNIAIDELDSLQYELNYYNEQYSNDDDIQEIKNQIALHQFLISSYDELKLKHAQANENIMSRREAAHLRRNNG